MIISALISLVFLRTSNNPDRVLILGVPFTQDEQAIWRDCATWKTVWETRGVSQTAIIYQSNVRTAKQLTSAFEDLKKSIPSNQNGSVWICVSGHGTILNSKPAINCQPNPDSYEPVPWEQVFKQPSLPQTWKAVLLRDLCHNNVLIKVLPKRYQAISLNQPPENETCHVLTHNYGADGMRGVISWVVCRNLNETLDLATMVRAMTKTCSVERKTLGAPAYKFRLDIGSKTVQK